MEILTFIIMIVLTLLMAVSAFMAGRAKGHLECLSAFRNVYDKHTNGKKDSEIEAELRVFSDILKAFP